MSLTVDPALSTADAIADALASAGTEFCFGVPGGGANLDLVGALDRRGIQFVLTHMETPAAIMAATYADLTGRPGVCLATRGPGALSLANGVAQAYLDRSPLIAITDAIAPKSAVRFSRQRISHSEFFRAITKWSTPIGAAHADETMADALAIACQGRPGPVHLDALPESTSAAPKPRTSAGVPRLAAERAAAEMLRASLRPVVVIGMGAVSERERVRTLVERSGCVAMTTYRAKGVVPETSAQHAGLVTGGVLESEALKSSDLIIMLGVDPVEFIPSPWDYDAPLLSLTPWERDADYYLATVELVAPLGETLAILEQHLPNRPANGTSWRLAAQDAVHIPVAGLAPHEITSAARQLAPAGTIATVDAGAHMIVAMPDWVTDAYGETLISSGHATMGYSLPAAIAAALVHPERRVVCFTGDGGLGMVAGELETAVRLNLSLTIVVFNDSDLSLISIKRDPIRHGTSPATHYRVTDFAGVAAAYGANTASVSDAAAFRDAFSRSLTTCGPTLIDASIDPSGYKAVLAAARGDVLG